jgi:hypothetical protein
MVLMGAFIGMAPGCLLVSFCIGVGKINEFMDTCMISKDA